jgi:outer membrane protein OmpA-like peptidoglycan-associated protein
MLKKLLLGSAIAALAAGPAIAQTTTSDEPGVTAQDVRQSPHEQPTEVGTKFGMEQTLGQTAPHPVFVFDQETEEGMSKLGARNVSYVEFEDEAVREMVYFPFDSAQLTDQAAEKVDKFADMVQAEGLTDIEVYGFTDTVDTDQYNMRLSENRAMTVAAHLRSEGIPAKYIGTAWFGEKERYLARETGEGERAQANRRVIMIAE